MERPPYLEPGDLIGIVAPARPVRPGQVLYFTERMEAAGYFIRTGEIYREFRQFSGRDEERLADLQAMLDDPEIRAVFCARGGYGSVRLLEGLSLKRFMEAPKWIAGFSDISALHQVIATVCSAVTLHAPMPYTLQQGSESRADAMDQDLAYLIRALQGEALDYEMPPDPLNRSGYVEGLLTGGNLSVLYGLMGTKYQVNAARKILFLEEVDEYLYHLDRMMWNLRLAGVLEGVGGLIIGHMTGMRDNELPFGQSAFEIIREAVEPYDFPVCFGFPAGHEEPNLPLRLGHPAVLEVSPQFVRFHQEP